MATMQEIKTTLETKAQEYNGLLLEKKYDKIPTITKEMDELVQDYAKKAKEEFIETSKAAENPLIDALTRLTYTVVAYRDVADKETSVVTRTITDKTRQISLADLYTAMPSKFRASNWKYYVEKLNLLMCLWVAMELGAPGSEIEKIKSDFRMDAAARDISMGKTPTSNTQLLAQVQTTMDQILYDEETVTVKGKTQTRNRYRVTSHDVVFLRHAYTKLGREVKHISCLNHAKLALVLAQIMNEKLTNTGYKADYAVNKEKAAAGNVEVVQEAKSEPESKSKDSEQKPESKQTTRKPRNRTKRVSKEAAKETPAA